MFSISPPDHISFDTIPLAQHELVEPVLQVIVCRTGKLRFTVAVHCVCCFLACAHARTHNPGCRHVKSGIRRYNPLSLKTGAILLTYTNARLLTQVITFSQRPGLHTHTHAYTDRLSFQSSLAFPVSHTPTGTTHQQKHIYLDSLLFYKNVSAKQMAEKHNPSGRFMTSVLKRSAFPLFVSQLTSPFFFPLLLWSHCHCEIPHSWPSCLFTNAVLLLYQTLPHCPHLSSGGFIQPPFLRRFFLVSPPRLGRKETTHIHDSLSLFFLRGIRSAGEGGARGVVLSWPDGQPALCLL